MNTGKSTASSGPVSDCGLSAGALPKIKEALTVQVKGETRVMEVAQHIGQQKVRCILLGASENMARGMQVQATGHGIEVPVGGATLGRMFNLLGQPLYGEQLLPPDTM